MKKITSSVKTHFVSMALASAGVLAFISCSPKHVQIASVQTPPVAVSSATVNAADTTEASLRGGEFVAIPDLSGVSFNYDSAKLSAEARATLKKNAAYLKDHSDLNILVTGNCDQRGTVEYNLALGQRRAKAVRGYYIRLGISGHRTATISYGKEKLLCDEMTESCWAKNRRADTLARAQTTAQAQSQTSQVQ